VGKYGSPHLLFVGLVPSDSQPPPKPLPLLLLLLLLLGAISGGCCCCCGGGGAIGASEAREALRLVAFQSRGPLDVARLSCFCRNRFGCRRAPTPC
jgi:hypothetical protein